MSSITSSQLSCAFPALGSSKSSEYASSMNSMMSGILTTSCDWAAFLGNAGTESVQMTVWTQVPCDSATDAPYCGRGPLQITFDSNYEFCAEQTSYCSCPTIYDNPELVSSDTNTGFGTAACVWGIMSGHDLSSNSDGSLAGFKETACYINAGHSPCGDPNGWESRQSYWYQANDCLGISEDLWMEDYKKFKSRQQQQQQADQADGAPSLRGAAALGYSDGSEGSSVQLPPPKKKALVRKVHDALSFVSSRARDFVEAFKGALQKQRRQ
jgi:predicted chitinase